MADSKSIQRENVLSNLIIGLSFEIFNALGYGLSEKVYQNALEQKLLKSNIGYKREKYAKIVFEEAVVGRYFLDFLVESKLAIELKVCNEVYKTHINQLLNYLKSKNLKLGLLIVFSKNGVLIKRVIN